ncbi:type II secretion system protein [bacterium]|nr:type II secretion system protein [bacterium]
MKSSQLFNKQFQLKRNPQSGFTLIEIVISVGIIASLSLYAVNAMSNQIETRNRLQQSNGVIHSAHSAMMRLTDDLRHAFFATGNDEQAAKSNSDLIGRPMFVLNQNPRLLFMTQSYQSLIANRPESNIAYVQYVVCPDNSAPANVCRGQGDALAQTKQLVRIVDPGVKKISDDAIVDGVSQVLVNDLKELKISAWNGQDFILDWNTERSDYGRKMPKMVKIDLSVYTPDDPLRKQLREEGGSTQLPERASLKLSTIVYLMYTAGQTDLKEPKSEMSWVQ